MTEVASTRRGRQLMYIVIVVALTIPGLMLRFTDKNLPDPLAAFLFGLAIVGAAFLLSWAAELLQLDVAQGLALAVIALIAVLPEYAVDFVFAYKAGKDPSQAPLALANMTGANRLLIGVGWSLVVILAAYRLRRIAKTHDYKGEIDTTLRLEHTRAIELSVLTIATVYSLTLPLKRTITLIDFAVLFTLFGFYVYRISKAPAQSPHLVGPPAVIGQLPKAKRRTVLGIMFVFAASVIILCAEPFAESLVASGETLGISEFVLVQWLAPLASEAPELLVAVLFAWRLNTDAALGALVSSKVNQWTLLVGSLPLVFAVSSGALHGLPVDALQREELFLTAAQSVFAIAVLSNLRMSVREAWTLFGLFAAQFVVGGILNVSGVSERWYAIERIGVGLLYLVLGALLILRDFKPFKHLIRDGLTVPVRDLIHEEEPNTADELRARLLARERYQ